MGQFDQFANQGGPAAESADALAEARRKADDQLRTADYSGDLPEPLSAGDSAGGQDDDTVPAIETDPSESEAPVARDGGDDRA